jgi:hypothetical protein
MGIQNLDIHHGLHLKQKIHFQLFCGISVQLSSVPKTAKRTFALFKYDKCFSYFFCSIIKTTCNRKSTSVVSLAPPFLPLLAHFKISDYNFMH